MEETREQLLVNETNDIAERAAEKIVHLNDFLPLSPGSKLWIINEISPFITEAVGAGIRYQKDIAKRPPPSALALPPTPSRNFHENTE